jgi:hypothetical protein
MGMYLLIHDRKLHPWYTFINNNLSIVMTFIWLQCGYGDAHHSRVTAGFFAWRQGQGCRIFCKEARPGILGDLPPFPVESGVEALAGTG